MRECSFKTEEGIAFTMSIERHPVSGTVYYEDEPPNDLAITLTSETANAHVRIRHDASEAEQLQALMTLVRVAAHSARPVVALGRCASTHAIDKGALLTAHQCHKRAGHLTDHEAYVTRPLDDAGTPVGSRTITWSDGDASTELYPADVPR